MKNRQEQLINSISVVIPAKNEELNVARCLKAVSNQKKQPIECIVVDNGSIDRTIDIAKSLGAITISLPGVNISELRNSGAAIAKGNIIAFLDADCEPKKDWLYTAEKVLSKEDIGL